MAVAAQQVYDLASIKSRFESVHQELLAALNSLVRELQGVSTNSLTSTTTLRSQSSRQRVQVYIRHGKSTAPAAATAASTTNKHSDGNASNSRKSDARPFQPARESPEKELKPQDTSPSHTHGGIQDDDASWTCIDSAQTEISSFVLVPSIRSSASTAEVRVRARTNTADGYGDTYNAIAFNQAHEDADIDLQGIGSWNDIQPTADVLARDIILSEDVVMDGWNDGDSQWWGLTQVGAMHDGGVCQSSLPISSERLGAELPAPPLPVTYCAFESYPEHLLRRPDDGPWNLSCVLQA